MNERQPDSLAAAPWRPNEAQTDFLGALLDAPNSHRLFEWAAGQQHRPPDPALADLLPFAYRQLAEVAPDAPITRVSRDAYVETSQANLLKINRLLTAVHALETAGIDAVVLKGAALLLRYYDGYGQRPMQDVDLLVMPDDVDRALRSLHPLGWRPFGDASTPARQQRLRVDHALALVADPSLSLDLHWTIASGVRSTKTDEVFAAADTVTHGQATLRIPSHEDLLFQTLVHAIQPTQQPSCRWVVDAAVIIDTAGPELSWERVLDLTGNERMTARVREALTVLAAVAPGRVPADALQRLAALPVSSRERRELALFAKRPPHPASRIFRWHWHRFLRLRAADASSRGWARAVGFSSYLRDRAALRQPATAATTPFQNRSSRSPSLLVVALCALLALGAYLRLQGLDWDQGQHLHPDERFLTMLAVDLKAPSSIANYFDTAHSPLNPANTGRAFFVYGTFPLFLTKAVASLLGLADYGHVHLVGRALAALFDLGTILLTFLIGRRLASDIVGLAAAALVTFCVLSIQSAHFFTVDSFATCFSTAALLCLVEIVYRRGWQPHVWFGVAFGLALASRPNLVLLSPFYAAALAIRWFAQRPRRRELIAWPLLAVATTTLVFRVLQPYAFQSGFWNLRLAPTLLASFSEASRYASGVVDFPPAVQWIGRLPIVFPARNLVLWGLGPAWGVLALIALPLLARRRWPGRDGRGTLAFWLMLSLALFLFLFQGIQFTTTLRYFLPIVPVLAIVVALWLCGVVTRRTLARATLLVVIGVTALWAFAFTAIYRRPHTRVVASSWIFDNVRPGSTIATEHWDDGLPLRLTGRENDFVQRQLLLYDDENEGMRQQLIDTLSAADTIVISSNRLYGSIPRAPWRYPLARRYYELLFADALGFRLTQVFSSYPTLAGVQIVDDDAEEAFTVHDHPKVLIFQKTADFNRALVEQRLGTVSLAGIVRVTPVEASQLYRRMRPPPLALPDAAGRTASATASALSASTPPATAASMPLALRWLLVLEALSLACFAVIFTLVPGVRDRGYALAKLLAWLAPGTVVWLLATTGITDGNASTSRIVAAAIVMAGGAMAWRRREHLRDVWRAHWREFCAIEITWIATLSFFLVVHAANPAIFWGEKPMDFAILNALLRGGAWPPADPWFAGEALNYSYFGHALVAVFAHISGTPATFAFNLALGTLAALLATMAFAVAFQVTGRIVPGIVAVLFTVGAGNLAGVRTALAGRLTRVGFDYFWATSRVVPDTVNEYPFWNLVFGDLHAHVMVMPLEVALVFVGTLWVTRAAVLPAQRASLAMLSAWLLGAIAMTSTWSLPAAAVMLGAMMLTGGIHDDDPRAGVTRAIGWGALVALLAAAISFPFWNHYTFPPRRVGWAGADTATVRDVLTVFGAFAIVLAPAGAVLLARSVRTWKGRLASVALLLASAAVATWWRTPTCGAFTAMAALGVLLWLTTTSATTRIAAVLLAGAGVLGMATETVYIWDRLNTVFKFYLQMWLLLAPATALLAWQARTLGGRIVGGLINATVAIALVAGAFTSLTGLAGFIREPHASTPTFTLDGSAYLETMNPGEQQAFAWLNREVAGIPVILEAQGPFYGPFSRVSMNTGLPTVLGWEYHLSQQGRSSEQLQARAAQVRELFETTDATRADLLMRRYHVDLVYVGRLERSTYPRAGLEKFDRSSSLQTVFRNSDVTIYATPQRALSTKTWIDPVPPTPLPLAASAPLREARGLALAPDHTLVIADFGHGRMQRVDADLTPVSSFGQRGDGPDDFRDPCDLVIRPDGTVLVADTWNHRIRVTTPGGAPVAEWRAGLYGPRGIALAADGSALVTDTGNHRVMRFAIDGNATELVPRGQLDNPVGIAVDRDDLIYVADTGHRRIVVFDQSGTVVREWPIAGWTPGPRLEPSLAISPDGLVWVTDPTGGRVLLFDRTGQPRGVAASSPLVDTPLGIEAMPDGSAVVTDGARERPIAIQRPPDVPALRLQTPTRKSPAR